MDRPFGHPRRPPPASSSRLRATWLLLLLLGASACDWVAPFEDGIPVEEGPACADGLDNDLDGLGDCDDPSCRCDGCGGGRAVVPPAADGLGAPCSISCACRRAALDPTDPADRNLRVCNLSVETTNQSGEGRCAPVDALDASGEPVVEEGRFWARFVVTPTGQNVVGLARFQGQRFAFERALTDLGGRRRELRTGAGDLVLEAFLEDARPADPQPRFAVGDGIEPGRSDAARAQLGPITEGVLGGVNQIAIVETSTLTLERLDDGIERGAWRGVLRAPAAVDRARGGRCPPDQVYHPEPQRCFPELDDRAAAFFAFGCVLDPGAPPGAGLLAFWWASPWAEVGSPQVSLGGECVARAEAGELELRLRNGRTRPPQFVVELALPLDRVAPGTSLTLGPGSGRVAEVHRGATEGPLFALDLAGAPDARLGEGRVFIEQIRFEGPPRVFGWLETLRE